MISHCGLDCSACEAFIATQDNDDNKRQQVAEQWTIQYQTDISPNQINCTGCKSNGTKFFFTENVCEIRKCNIKNGTDNCAKCPDYKCETLKEFIKLAPAVGEALEKLRVDK